MGREPLIVEVPTVLSRLVAQQRREAWEAMSERDRHFLQIAVDGEAEHGPRGFGVVAFSGGDASTIRSLVRRGLLEYLAHVTSGDDCFRTEKERPGYTLTKRAREILAARCMSQETKVKP